MQLQGASGIQPFQLQKVGPISVYSRDSADLIAILEERQSTSSEHMFQFVALAAIRVVRATPRKAHVCNLRDWWIWQSMIWENMD